MTRTSAAFLIGEALVCAALLALHMVKGVGA